LNNKKGGGSSSSSSGGSKSNSTVSVAQKIALAEAKMIAKDKKKRDTSKFCEGSY